jgi:hypothetical protein
MKISPSVCHFVEYQGQDFIRLGVENWLRRYGESYETEYHCQDEEAAFQAQRDKDFESDKNA